jgi:DNA primase
VESVLLVEGSGDFLAAWHFITAERLHGRCAAVAMTGAANWIPPEALEEIARKRVRIFPHLDTSKAGEMAALRWETQITTAGGVAHCFDLSGLVTVNGDDVGDLNDVLLMERHEIGELGSITNF